MPADGDARDTEQAGDRGGVELLELVQDDDGAPPRRQPGERRADVVTARTAARRVGRIALVARQVRRRFAACAPAAEIVARQVHQHADEPRLAARRLGRHALRPARGAQEGLLNQVLGGGRIGDQAHRQPVEASAWASNSAVRSSGAAGSEAVIAAAESAEANGVGVTSG